MTYSDLYLQNGKKDCYLNKPPTFRVGCKLKYESLVCYSKVILLLNKVEERRILINRFFFDDRRLYQIGKHLGIEWFDKFDTKFAKDKYAYFSLDEKREAIERIIHVSSDEKFIQAINKIMETNPPSYLRIDRFIGRYYFFDAEKRIFRLEDRRDIIREDVRGALKETRDAGYFFLKAIIELWKEGRWDKAYGGATWVDILAKIRELGGRYPSPRHLAILKSYRIYYKTGSRRYPTHTIPEEIIPVVEEVLKEWERKI